MIADRAGACQLRWEDVPLFGIMGSLADAETLVQAKIVNQFNGELYIRYFDSTTPPGSEVRLSSGDTISIAVIPNSLVYVSSGSRNGLYLGSGTYNCMLCMTIREYTGSSYTSAVFISFKGNGAAYITP